MPADCDMADCGRPDNFSDTQIVRKSVAWTRHGVVASQHKLASRAGAEILAAGGDAIDAAVAVSFALGVVEPWMSGILGGGMMTVWRNAKCRTERGAECIEFGMRAPLALDPADYPLDPDRSGARLSPWPAVVGDRNIYGATAIGVPGVVAGMDAAHRSWGRLPWADVVQPARQLAREGLRLDWFASMMIAYASRSLARDPDAADLFLEDGQWPNIGGWSPNGQRRLDQSRLADTLDRIAHAGAGDFYRGDLARTIVKDVQDKGGCLSDHDLSAYSAKRVPPLSFGYRNARVHVPAGLCVGPDLKTALEHCEAAFTPGSDAGAARFVALADALAHAQRDRLAHAGHAAGQPETCTTAFCVVDKDGNMVSVTQTLLSVFGAHTLSASTGSLMNNAIMWFEPVQGRPNALQAGRDCLMNICPTIIEAPGGRYGLSASGGRKILSCIANLTSSIVDEDMSLEEAFHAPRIDMSAVELPVIDLRLADAAKRALRARWPGAQYGRRGSYPYLFGVPAGVCDTGKKRAGCSEPHSAWGDAVGEEEVGP